MFELFLVLAAVNAYLVISWYTIITLHNETSIYESRPYFLLIGLFWPITGIILFALVHLAYLSEGIEEEAEDEED